MGVALEALFISLFLVGLVAFILGFVGLFKPLVNLRMANRKWAGAWIFGGFVVMMIAAVNAPPTPPKSESAVASDDGGAKDKLVIPEPTREPLPPEPKYASIDGDEYLYGVSLSDDARKAGQIASEFIAFRYRGVRDGKITLTSDGATLRCDEDCRVISITDEFGDRQHLEFNPDSVAGMAFTDAMNGLLVERPSLSQQTRRPQQPATLDEANRELERTLRVCGADGCNDTERAILDRN